MRSLKTKVSLLSFGSAASNQPNRETIRTPYGAIYAGTPEAQDYLALKAYFDPLEAFVVAQRLPKFGAVDACSEIAKLLPLLPASASGITETLKKLAAALSGGPVSAADPPSKWLYDQLEAHLVRCEFGLSSYYARAPKPPHPLTVYPPQTQRLGTGSRWHN